MLNEYNQGRLIFKLYGVEESSLTEYKKYLLANFGGGVTADFERKGDDFTLYLWKEDGADNQLFDRAVKSFINTFSSFIYANEEVTLAENAVALLKIASKTLCSAESFTGGAIANAIVRVPGASEVFYEGLVCYNTNAKIERLGVSPITVKSHTVVSREVAFEMVRGLIEGGKCDIAVATTGYASPTGDKEKPCGLCYVAVANEQRAEVFRYNLKGTREQIINKGTELALFAVNKLLRG